MKKIFLIASLFSVMVACKSGKGGGGTVRDEEPTYKRDRRSDQHRSRTESGGAVGAGTGSSYGSVSSGNQSTRKSRKVNKENQSVRPQQ